MPYIKEDKISDFDQYCDNLAMELEANYVQK
jgi:hypothetical protein